MTPAQSQTVKDHIELRLLDPSKFEDAESLALYELKYEPLSELLGEDKDLQHFMESDAIEFIPNSILEVCKHSAYVPMAYNSFRKEVTVFQYKGCTEELPEIEGFTLIKRAVPLFVYFKAAVIRYGSSSELLNMPAKILYNYVVNEAISLGASDITISSYLNACRVYYNIRKKTVESALILSNTDLRNLIPIITFKTPVDLDSRLSKSVGVVLNDDYRGRVMINKTVYGEAVTIRLLPNRFFNLGFEDLNLTPHTQEFLKRVFLSDAFGLRLIVGATSSGKNTTALSCLNQVVRRRLQKVVSIERPVEQYIPGVEQIDCQSDEEYDDAVNSLLRQNPDYVYVTEMSENTAKPAIRIANTGKVLMSTLHANSCADTIGRLEDITGLSIDKIIQSIHGIVYQELVRDEEKDMVYPHNTMLELTEERKQQLYGKPYGEVLRLLRQWEEVDSNG